MHILLFRNKKALLSHCGIVILQPGADGNGCAAHPHELHTHYHQLRVQQLQAPAFT